MIANQVLKMQEESKTMMTRYVEESKKREEMLKREQVYVLLHFLKKISEINFTEFFRDIHFTKNLLTLGND